MKFKRGLPKNLFTGISAARRRFFLEFCVGWWRLLLSMSGNIPSMSIVNALSKSKLVGRAADFRVKTISSSCTSQSNQDLNDARTKLTLLDTRSQSHTRLPSSSCIFNHLCNMHLQLLLLDLLNFLTNYMLSSNFLLKCREQYLGNKRVFLAPADDISWTVRLVLKIDGEVSRILPIGAQNTQQGFVIVWV